jgi:hypothetical protein
VKGPPKRVDFLRRDLRASNRLRVEELSGRDAQSGGELLKHLQRRELLASLDSTDVGEVKAARNPTGQLSLGEPSLAPKAPKALANHYLDGSLACHE